MHIHDVLIIGAGPCGLAVAARLREYTPSATFTDDEHQRYHWIRKHGRKMNIKNYRTNTDSLNTTPNSNKYRCLHNESLDMLVLDADGGDWMTKWNRLFNTFGIEYLRSPMFFHIDPADRDALLGYAYEHRRENELQALPGCAGKEVSKHRKKKKMNRGGVSQSGPDVDERDRKDYFTPSSKLFRAHCDEITSRYGLGENMIQQEKVVDIRFDDLENWSDAHDSVVSEDESMKIFRVETDKDVRYAHIVVLAIGPGNAPAIPQIAGIEPSEPHEGFSHAMQIKQYPPAHVAARISQRLPTNILIVGGGLTSIQLADLAIRRGVSKVWLLMRGGIKVKYFDVDLDWVGKFRNFNQAAFWSADNDEERFQMITEARNGGSMTPRYRKILDAYVESKKISLHTHTTLESLKWDGDLHQWTSAATAPSLAMPWLDYIVFATGIQSNAKNIPILQGMQVDYPIEHIGGLPCLNDDLMWADDVPLFVTGRLAGLRLGPGAPNLVGARVGAERIAWNVQDLLKKFNQRDSSDGSPITSEDSDDERMAQYAAGRRNRFNSLVGMNT